MDWFDVAQHGEDVADAFRRIGHKRIEVVGITSDTLFPLRQQEQLVTALEMAGIHTQLYTVESQKA